MANSTFTLLNSNGTGGGGSGETMEKNIIVTHALNPGDFVYLASTGVYTLASNASAVTAEVVGYVSAISTTVSFTLQMGGYISAGLSALTADAVYFLGVDGGYTSTEPTSDGTISKPLFVAKSSTDAVMLTYRGNVVGPAATNQDLIAPNLVLNPNANTIARGSSFDSTTTPPNSDGNFIFDRWILNSDGNDIADVTRETAAPPTGTNSSFKFEVETANKKFGFLQYLATDASVQLDGDVASLTFQTRKVVGNATLDTIRCALISYTGALASAPTDIVSAWGAAGADPTLAANFTYESTPSNITLTDSWVTHTVENVSIDTGSVNSVVLFFWVDDVDATVNDIWTVGKIQVQKAATASSFMQVDGPMDAFRCKFYFTKIKTLCTNSGWTNHTNSFAFPTMRSTAPSFAYTIASGSGGVYVYMNGGTHAQSYIYQSTSNSTPTSAQFTIDAEIGVV